MSQTLHFTYSTMVLSQAPQQARLEAFAGHPSTLPGNQVILMEPNQTTALIRILRYNGLWKEPPLCPNCFPSGDSPADQNNACSLLLRPQMEAGIKVDRSGVRHVHFNCTSCKQVWWAERESWWSLNMDEDGWQRQHWVAPYPFEPWILKLSCVTSSAAVV
jgi:hypothetical protein